MKSRINILTMEEINDGLEVTKAIETTQRNSSDASEVAEIIEQQEEVLNSEDPNQSDEGDVIEDEDGLSLDPSPTEEEIKVAIESITALESILCDINEGVVTEGSISQVNSISKDYKCPCELNSVIDEDSKQVAIESIKTILSSIWRNILNALNSLIDNGKTSFDIFRGKLKVSKEDLEKVRSNVSKIKGNSTTKTTIDNHYNRFLIIGNARTPRDVITTLATAESQIKLYVQHLRNNFRPYMDSVMSVLTVEPSDAGMLQQTTDDSGVKSINTRGSIRLNKDTVPGFLKSVIEIKGMMKPFDNVFAMKSSTMVGGVIMGAWVCKDDDVSTAERTNALGSKVFMTNDPDYDIESTDLPVMNPNEVNTYLDALDRFQTTMESAEGIIYSYYSELGKLKALVDKFRKESEIIEKSPNGTDLKHIIAFKNRLGILTQSLVTLTDNFYGKPNRSIMFFGNRILTSSIKYVNAITTEHIGSIGKT